MSDNDKFIAELYPAAVKISRETGMSKELILAQAAQETGWGQHVLAGTNNTFNIRASADAKRPTKRFKVWEIEQGQNAWTDQEPQVQESPEDLLRDRVKFCRKKFGMAMPHSCRASTMLYEQRHVHLRRQSARRPHFRNAVMFCSAQNVAKRKSEATCRWLLLCNESTASASSIRVSRRGTYMMPIAFGPATGELT
ncbi:MAG: glucosaminidase domain-containing protein [Rhodanobacter sp.]